MNLGSVTYGDDEVEFIIKKGRKEGELFLAIPVGDDCSIAQVSRAKVSSTGARFYGPDNVTSSLSLPHSDDLIDMLNEVEDAADNFGLTFNT
jgi:hypothetical protein